METAKVKDYAAAHGIKPSVLLDLVSERLDERVTPARQIDTALLDEARDLIRENAVEDLVEARDWLADVRTEAAESIRAAELDLRRSVRDALGEGMPATGVAEVLGVSRARVYQIRDGKR